MNTQEKITAIIDWSLENRDKRFNSIFVYDLQEKLDEFGKLTRAQERSLDNIIEKWGIDA